MTLYSEPLASQIAAELLHIEAIKISVKKPFKWASGWYSPIYCDNRKSLSYPKLRTTIKNGLAAMIKKQFPDVECIAGVATAGIPQGALVSDELYLPMIYVRSQPKGHGLGNKIEGAYQKNQKVVVIEDLVSTGKSSLEAVSALREAGMEVIGMAAIFTYGLKVADENFGNAKWSLYTLCDYPSLIKESLASGKIDEDELQSLKSWRVDPQGWK